MKYLNGKDLADFIKERQARQVRALRQAHRIYPRLAIISTSNDPVIDTYMRLKKAYGEDVLIDVDIHRVDQAAISTLIDDLNGDANIYGIIVQLPLADPSQTDEIINLISPSKDVDGLGDDAQLDAATPTAINWLLAGYNVDLKAKKIAIVGQGRLVGAPLARMWQNSGYDITVFDENNQDDMRANLNGFDVIVTATGVPGLIGDELVKFGAVVVDAGTASENGVIVGDLAADVRSRDDLTITPEKGGVGPLTIAALFDNVIRTASDLAKSNIE